MFVGAYAAVPPEQSWGPGLAAEFIDGLRGIEGVDGVEAPWFPSHEESDADWIAGWLPPQWSVVLTDIPHVMARLRTTPDYGLASPAELGRAAALDDADALRRHAGRLRRAGVAVPAVELHSAPRARGSLPALAASIREIMSWEWSGTEVLIEHCDAWLPNQTPEKGFLPLEDELTVAASGKAGVSMNWGRSAIELRDPNRVVDQVRTAAASGSLRAFVVSGCGSEDSEYGHAWKDAHLPFSEDLAVPSASVLTEQRLAQTLAALPDGVALGVKVAVRPADASVPERIETIRRAVARVASLVAAQNGQPSPA